MKQEKVGQLKQRADGGDITAMYDYALVTDDPYALVTDDPQQRRRY